MDVRVLSGKRPDATRRPFGLRRMTGLAVLTVLVAAAVVYLQVAVPIAGPDLARADAVHYWQVAMIAGLVVLVGTAAVAWLCLRAWRRSE
jgi:hypothetical protein